MTPAQTKKLKEASKPFQQMAKYYVETYPKMPDDVVLVECGLVNYGELRRLLAAIGG